MKKFAYYLFGISFVLFLLSIVALLYHEKKIDTETFYASVNITTERGGFDLNGTALTFGNIVRGGSGTRSIIFQNNYEFPVVTMISVGGEISELLIFDKKVEIEPGESKEISFSAYSDIDEDLGFYSGEVEFEILQR